MAISSQCKICGNQTLMTTPHDLFVEDHVKRNTDRIVKAGSRVCVSCVMFTPPAKG